MTEIDPAAADSHSSSERRGVFVLGMHRSGTSAAARLVNIIGVPLGREDDLFEALPSNPKGHWESLALTRVNDRILRRFGGGWSAPPELEPGWWTNEERIADLRETATETFAEIYGDPVQWAWKDPRNCITLPFWTEVLGAQPACVVVHRDPVKVCRSLADRDGFSKHLSLALWERYTRDLLSTLGGLPAIVTAFEDLVGKPRAWVESVCDFLREQGFTADASDTAAIDEFVEPKPADEASDDDPDLSAAQRELYDLVTSLHGTHQRFEAPTLPPPTPWMEPILAEHREMRREAAQRKRMSDDAQSTIEELERARAEIERSRAKVDKLGAELKRLGTQLEVARQKAQLAQEATQGAEEKFEAEANRRRTLKKELDEIRASRSYRLTAPLRAANRRLKRDDPKDRPPRATDDA